MNKNRDSKTGRFISKAKTTKKVVAKEATPKKVQFQILINDLPVFGKKSMEGNTTKIKAGATIILKEMGDGAVRVKKEGASRTFYTREEMLEGCF